MADTKELKKIKKIYGERFANLCRDMFSTILESEGKLLTILEETFSHNCNSLYESITQNYLEIDFKDLIYSKFDKEREEQQQTETKTPYEILEEAGYDLYECKTERDIQKFRKYYAKGEVLCTIYNGGRLNTRDCFFAVKKDVDEIKRKDFQNPQKNDEYSTSVLGIQFTREKNSHVQIISRYNHTVSNPNCTLNNDLDKLAPGLKQSFANLLEERGMNINVSHTKSLFEIPGYTLARDGKYYKYNMEIGGNYYCPGNIIISNGMPRQVIEPEKGIIIDYFLLDLENKAITNLTNLKREKFQEGLQDIDKIQVKTSTDKKSKIIEMYLIGKKNPVIIEINNDNQITRYENQYLQKVGDTFLYCNGALAELNLPQLQEIGDDFLFHNKALTKINLPQLQEIGYGFLLANGELTEVNLPQLEEVGDDFLYANRVLTEVNLPQLHKVGDNFLAANRELTEVNLPQLQEVGDDFLYANRVLTELNLPKLEKVGRHFLSGNKALTEVNLPKMPELESELKNIAIKNQPKKKEITPTDIAVLDRKSELTTSEIEDTKNNRKIEKISKDERDVSR